MRKVSTLPSPAVPSVLDFFLPMSFFLPLKAIYVYIIQDGPLLVIYIGVGNRGYVTPQKWSYNSPYLSLVVFAPVDSDCFLFYPTSSTAIGRLQ